MAGIFEAIRDRRSVRRFKKDEVPTDYIYKILDAARYAPSAGNLQPWEFIIVDDETMKEKVAHACMSQKFIAEAPVIIIACADTDRSGAKYSSRGKIFYSICDVAAAVENLMLAASAFGLGTCWVGAFDTHMLEHCLKLPKAVVPMAVIPLGYPDCKPETPKRTELSNILHFGEYGRYKKLEGKGLSTKTAEPVTVPEPTLAGKKEAPKKRQKGLMDVFR